MRVASWNVNSIRARKERVHAWLEKARPDVACLQQKTYNGVAILSRGPLENVRIGLDDGEEPDPQARLVAATIGGVRVLSVYVPNGQAVGSDKYDYKLRWLRRLVQYLRRHHDPSEPLAICGDFNVAPEARDVHDPKAWEESTLFHATSRAELRALMDWGLVDVFRIHHDEPGKYSWWDYQMLGFPKNRGLRIDLVLATRSLAERVTGSEIDREERKGKAPSDHAPVIVEVG